MSKVGTWSTTAGSNNSSPPDGWPEGMQRSAVNDAAREMMSALARWYQDQEGTLVSAGTSTAYTLTTNSAHAAIGDQMLTAWRAHVANTGAVTLAVDGLTAKSLVKLGGSALVSGDILINQIMLTIYNANLDRYEWMNSQASAASATDAGIVELATAAEMVTGTDTGRVPAVSTTKNHEGVAKAWGSVTNNGTAALEDSYGVTSANRSSIGTVDVTLSVTMANDDYVVAITVGEGATTTRTVRVSDRTTTTFQVIVEQPTSGDNDDEDFMFVVFGTLA